MRWTALLLLWACKPPVDPPSPWVQVLAKPCALAADGTIACWSSDQWLPSHHFTPPPSTQAIALQSNRPGVLRALGSDGFIETLACPPGPPDFCPALPFEVDRATDFGGLLGTTFVFDANHDSTATPPARDWAVIATDLIAAIDTSHRLWFAHAPELQLSLTSEPVALAAWIEQGEAGGCALDNSGTIDCIGVEGSPFDSPPYRLMSGAQGAACAVSGRSLVTCSDGSVRDLGDGEEDVHALDVVGFPYYTTSGDFIPAGVPSFCARVGERLHCEGPHYPPDLLASMPE